MHGWDRVKSAIVVYLHDSLTDPGTPIDEDIDPANVFIASYIDLLHVCDQASL